MAGEKWLVLSQVGKETTEGTAVAASRRLYANGSFTRERQQFIGKYQTGTRDNQREAKNRAVMASAKLEMAIGADEVLEYFLSAIRGGVTPSTADGASSWVFTPGAAIDSQTLEMFDGYRSWRMYGSKIDELKLSGEANGDTKLEATYWGRDVQVFPFAGTSGTSEVQTLSLGAASAGTFTITFLGQTTAAIAYNANAAAVQAALEALASIGTGNVTVTGGALPATTTLTFAGALATQPNLPLITVNSTGLTGATVTIARTATGASKTPLTDRVPDTFQGWESKLYLDAFGGTAGTTLISNTLISWEVAIKNHLARKYFCDNTVSAGGVPMGELEVEVGLVYEANAAGYSEYINWDQMAYRLLRLDLGNNGAVIGTSALKKRIMLDIPCAYSAIDLSGDDNGTRTYKATAKYIYDATNAFGLRATVQTSRATAY